MKATANFLLIVILATLIISCEKENKETVSKSIISTLKQAGDPPDPPGGGEHCAADAAQLSATNCNLSAFSNSDFNNMYFVRDSMFTYTSRGQSYISYYYSISEFIEENALFNNCEDFEDNYYQAYLDGFSMVANFANPFYSGILITDSLYSEFMEVSANLKDQDTANQITYILNGLEDDLNYLKNKPANDVRDFFDK